MLVAPADPARFGLESVVSEARLDVPSVIVASTNDRWMSFERAAAWADIWGSELLNLGAAGHINVNSGYGVWPRGLDIYWSLRNDAPPTFVRRAGEDVLEFGEI
jgi:uncharacterized protein